MHFFVAKLLSVVVMTYPYVYHLRNLPPVNLLGPTHTANKLHHATAARAHDAQPHCRLMSPFQRNPTNIRINFILPKTRVPELLLLQY